MKKNNLVITDHAIVRYLERVRGKNVEKIKSDILKGLKNKEFWYVVKDGHLITVIKKNKHRDNILEEFQDLENDEN
jgi:IS4 transposase